MPTGKATAMPAISIAATSRMLARLKIAPPISADPRRDVRWVTAWYRRHYGEVEQTARQKRFGAFVGGGGALAFLLPFQIEIFAMNSGQSLPVNLMDFTIALWIVTYWLYLGRPFWHYLVLTAIGIGLGIASIAGFPPATFAWHLREATLYIALASIVGGVMDHLILTRALTRSESPVGLES